MTIAEQISDMQKRGWTVTFPPLGGKLAFAVRANKNDLEWQRGYRPDREGEFEDAVARIHTETAEEYSGEKP